MVYKVYPFDQLLEAKAMMDSSQHIGKIVIQVA
jgi:NADPH:quinone reductase-like Zn-dependent oxidoreductase